MRHFLHWCANGIYILYLYIDISILFLYIRIYLSISFTVYIVFRVLLRWIVTFVTEYMNGFLQAAQNWWRWGSRVSQRSVIAAGDLDSTCTCWLPFISAQKHVAGQYKSPCSWWLKNIVYFIILNLHRKADFMFYDMLWLLCDS